MLAHSSRRAFSVSSRSVLPTSAVPYTEQQKRLGRPLSPHVTVYKQPVTAVSSILNRIAGTGLAIGFGGLGAIAAAGGDVPGWITATQTAAPGLMPFVKFLVAFPLTYHYIGGVRHLVWDRKPEYITFKVSQKSSVAAIGGAIAVSIAASFVTLPAATNDKDAHAKKVP
ncbi:hypothetical protein Poli38472_005656 [Pythium oligandrum]|uniref:Succinate dehydrogenase subunit C n=1 Tax=Pythium oligandrum TaxID=41045 RepID=A0A8K1CIE3_PYTOL|nr:hypothetical protein Poli38472_005656 [Pythium oligandrum]|eukprot:TMW63038.1 hypothetical protein Poli38472_005656 [Pythium oligandrum]